MEWFLTLLVSILIFCVYLLYRNNKVFKKQAELAEFVFDRLQDSEWDYESYRRRLRWLHRDCDYDYMFWTFWVWPLDKLVRGVYRDGFLEWKKGRLQ